MLDINLLRNNFEEIKNNLKNVSGINSIIFIDGRKLRITKKKIIPIENIKKVFSNYTNFKTKILAASVRSIEHVTEVAKAGADISTIPPKIFHQLYKHELTDKGLKIFLEDWEKSKQKI